jgi:hypothetical protein
MCKAMDQTPPPRRAPQAWLDILDQAEADVAAGRVEVIDVDALCREIETEANTIQAEQRTADPKSAA